MVSAPFHLHSAFVLVCFPACAYSWLIIAAEGTRIAVGATSDLVATDCLAMEGLFVASVVNFDRA